MNEQPLDARVLKIAARRHRRAIVGLALLGCALGVGLSLLLPPPYASNSLVVLKAPPNAAGGSSFDVATQAQVAVSEPVLSQALTTAKSDLSVKQLRRAISVTAPTPSLLRFTVKAPTASQASALAVGAAQAYETFTNVSAAPLTQTVIDQLKEQQQTLVQRTQEVESELAKARQRLAAAPSGSDRSNNEAQLVALLVGQQSDLAVQLGKIQQTLDLGTQASTSSASLTATVLEGGKEASRASPIGHAVAWSAALGLLGGLLGLAYALVRTRRDRRLRSAIDLSRAAGAPILAGINSRPQRRADDWPGFFASYHPPAVDAWAVRLMLRDLLGGDQAAGSPRSSRPPTPRTIVLITMSDDARGVALGPQIAVTATSLGVRTALVAAGAAEAVSNLSDGLVMASRSNDHPPELTLPKALRNSPRHELGLVVVTVDAGQPDLVDVPAASAYLLCVGPGAVTAVTVARLSLALDSAGHRLTGVVVADPEAWDLPSSGSLSLALPAAQPEFTVTPLQRVPDAGTRPGARGRDQRR